MGAVARQLAERLSAADYLAFVKARPEQERWQLIDGMVVMMTPPSLVHQLIAMNFAGRLNAALERHRPDLVALVEAGLTVPGREDFLPQADIVIVQGPVDYVSYASQVLLAAEVRSDSNTEEYLSVKRQRYSEHPDNLYSLVIAQRTVQVELWSRADDWKGVVFRSADDILALPEFGFSCALRDLYRGTPLA